MTLHRFFVPAEEMAGDRFVLPARIERQVRSVLRLGDGDRIALLPNDGTLVLCRLDAGACVVEERRLAGGEPRHRLTMVQALLKGDGLERVIQHATEVGVHRFQLVVAARCVARDISGHKLKRLRAIAREAAEQSERGIVPAVEAPVALAQALTSGSVLLYERHAGTGLAKLAQLTPPASVIIGPEGGFTHGEVEAATRAGSTLAGLGPRILRSETVAPAAAAVILSATGDFA
ncbi:MAG: RsmE family RNA methyltransferase [Candidatus Limnocylindria bacterium]